MHSGLVIRQSKQFAADAIQNKSNRIIRGTAAEFYTTLQIDQTDVIVNESVQGFDVVFNSQGTCLGWYDYTNLCFSVE